MGELTPEAKAAIAEAIRIVREDKMDAFVRDRLTKHTSPPVDPNLPPKPDPNKPPVDPNKPPVDPPVPDPNLPPGPPPEPEKSAWWGEIYRD